MNHSFVLYALIFLFTNCTQANKNVSSTFITETEDSIKANMSNEVDSNSGSQSKFKKATFAAGCFWCEEHVFDNIIGVINVVSGYAGGTSKSPSYEEVGSGKTDHAESFELEYDPSMISFASLLKVFFASQDPTQVNGQGPDHGRQYRSIVFYRNEEEKKLTMDYINELNASGKYSKLIATEVMPYTIFWIAEDYHQDYIQHHPENPYVQQESLPRYKRTKERVPEFFKK
jgi:methionine-S-sulfoxide reductase